MKNKAISKRLTIQVMGFMLSFSVVLLLANSLLLKPLYYHSVKTDMIEGMELLSAIEYSDDEWRSAIGNLDPGHSYDITVEQFGEIVYSSSREIGIRGPNDFDRNDRPELKKPFIPTQFVKDWSWINQTTQLGTLYDEKEGTHLFIAKMVIDEETTIYLTQGIEPILNSVRQANILLVSVTFLFLMIAGFMVTHLSKRFTRPIRMMQTHVGELSKLNFDHELIIETGDELENLSTDIHQLAIKLKDALNTLQKQNIQLENDVESQRKFISNASHELRTPLALIKGYADEITQGFVKDRDQEHKYIKYIAEESTKMKRLLNEILELSRIESGYMDFYYENIVLKKAIENFIEKYYGFIHERQLNISLELIDGIGNVDPVRFEQILANYLSNAGKYCSYTKNITIRIEEKKDVYRISVINSGQPIPQKIMNYIWDGFYKADEARGTDRSSYGLGLSIVRAIQNVSGQAYGCYNEENNVVFWFDVIKVS